MIVLNIKFKKDYIVGLENIVDFIIVNDCRDVRNETELYMKKLSWISFYVVCLKYKD